MGDLNTNHNPKSPPPPPSLLPPGFRFHPTEQQILSFYLNNKNNDRNPNTNHTLILSSPFLCLDLISEIDFYDRDPYEFPETDSFPYGYGGSKKHWYYFTLNRRKGGKRKSKGGFWKRKCRTRNVLNEGVLLGTKTSFVFYRRDRDINSSSSGRCCRTNWIMIEYALVDHQMDFFVLCRVFLKTCSANKVIKAGLSAHADVPHRQFDRASTSGIGEVVREDAFDNDVMLPHQLATGLNSKIAARPLSDNDAESSLGVLQSDQLVNLSRVTFDDIVADELRINTIMLEGDYLELDDLVACLCEQETVRDQLATMIWRPG